MVEPELTMDGPLSAGLFRDDHTGEITRLVYQMMPIVLVCATVFLPIGLVAAPEVMPLLVPTVGSIWLLCFAMLVLTRTGHPRRAARALVAGCWALSTWFAVLSGGIESPGAPGLLFVIAFAGILLGWRECLLAAFVTAITAAFLAAGRETGLLAAPDAWATPSMRAAMFVAYASTLAGLQIFSFRILMKVLARARRANEGLHLAGKVYDTTSEGIMITDPDGTIIDVNDAYCRIHACTREYVLGQNQRVLKSDRHTDEFYEEMWSTLISTGEWRGEVWDRRLDGTLVPKWLSITTLRNDAGEPTHYVGVFSDITALKQTEENLEWLATHDTLTGLPNRALMDDRLENALALARRHNTAAAVFFFDLDYFKDVNDTLGHGRGDELLVEIARRCKAVVRESDTVGRTGGDEFSVIVSDFTSTEDLEALAMRLLAIIAKPVCLGDREAYVSASIGVAVFPNDSTEAADLMRHADMAMYRAKSLGRNRVEFFSAGLQDEFVHRVEIESGLRRALAQKQFFLLYQPQVDLRSGRIIGVEALVRWRREDGTIMSPDRFIPIAEHCGLSVPLGDQVLEQAIRDLRHLCDEGHDLTMAVNFSARQFSEVDVDSDVIHALDSAGIDRSRFEVEITETSLMSKMESAAVKVATLLDAGVRVAVDDFGTGYASMSYVQHFHPSKLKIDRSFVSCVPADPSARAIVLATIALAKGIGSVVIAEGPETDEQVRFLQDCGCDYAQGYRFSRPIELAELEELLAAGPYVLPEREQGSVTDIGSGRPSVRMDTA